MKQLLDKIGKTFELTEGFRFSRAVSKVLDKNTTQAKKNKSLDKIYKLVKKAFEENEIFTSTLTKTEKSKLEKLDEEHEEFEMDEKFFKKVMQTYITIAERALENSYVDTAILMLKEKNKEIKDKDVTTELKKIKNNTSIADKKIAINEIMALFVYSAFDKVCNKYKITDWESKPETEIEQLLPKKTISSINKLDKLGEKFVKQLQAKNVDETLLVNIQNIFDQIDRILGKKKETKKEEQEPKYSLKRKKVKGKTENPIKTFGKKYKATIKKVTAGILIATVTITGAYLITKLVKNNNNQQENPAITNPIGPELPTISTMTDEEREAYVISEATKIQENWTKIGCDYTVSDICELIYFINGYESNISASIADDMILDVINRSTVPAINNALTGKKTEEVQPVEMSQLFINGQTGIDAIENMEDYLNESLENPNNKENAQAALKEEYKIVANNETVDGFSLETATSGEKLVWSRLALGTNAMTGLLGEDLTFNVNDKTYIQSDINDFSVFEGIATTAKKDLGEQNKSLTLSQKNN